MLRLFFAVTLPDEAREAVARVQAELRAELGEVGMRWVAPAQFHFTLKFLGETSEVQAAAARDAARSAAGQLAAFRLTIAHIGLLPHARKPQTLYAFVDITDGSFLLFRKLAECLDSELRRRGFPPEARSAFPHLTLARLRAPEGARAVRAFRDAHFQPMQHENTNYGHLYKVDKIASFRVDSFVLMRSELRPSGPTYTVLERFSLSHRRPPASPLEE